MLINLVFQQMVCVQQDIDSLKDVLSTKTVALDVNSIQEEKITSELLHLFPNAAFLRTNMWIPYESFEKGILEASRNNRTRVTKTADGKICGISFMVHFISKVGTTATIYYYGKDMESFKALVVDQLKQVVDERKAGTLAGLVHIPECISRSNVSEFLHEQLGFSHGPLPDSDTIIIGKKITRGACNL